MNTRPALVTRLLIALGSIVYSMTSVGHAEQNQYLLVSKAFENNYQICLDIYSHLSYELATINHRKLQKQSVVDKPTSELARRLRNLPSTDSQDITSVELETFGVSYWYHYVNTEAGRATADEPEDWEVIYDGVQTREVHYEREPHVTPPPGAPTRRSRALDVTRKGQGTRLLEFETPWGFMTFAGMATYGKTFSEFMLKVLSPIKNPVWQWMPGEGNTRFLSLTTKWPEGKESTFIFDAQQSFLPISIRSQAPSGSTRGEDVFKYRKMTVSDREFYYPESGSRKSLYFINGRWECVLEMSFKLINASFSEKAPEGAFKLNRLSETQGAPEPPH